LYAAAIDSGLSQSDIISDAPDLWPGMDEADGYRAGPGAAGEMTLRLALETSAQTAAVNLLGRIGIDYAAAAAQRMGIPSPLPHSLAPALGTMKTTLFELAAAYNTLAGGGMHVGPYAITEVRDASGVVLYRAVPKRRKVLETEAAAIVTDMMTGCVDPGRPAAGKAGFDEERGVALFVGYTPGLLAAVRVETNAARPDPDAGRAVWLDFMREVLADRPYEDFPLPMGVVLAPMNVYTGRPAEPGDPAFVMAAFREGRAPGADSP
jgi:penicillin-binding protein 1A